MEKIKDLLNQLIDLPGVSGFEDPVRDVLAENWRTAGFSVSENRIGSLIGFKAGSTNQDERLKVMIAAHMDAIGLVVRSISGDHLRVDASGGIDARVMPGIPVTLYATKSGNGAELIQGYIAMPHPKSLDPDRAEGLVSLDQLLVDVGLTNEELVQRVNIGDVIAIDTKPFNLNGNLICGHSIDNRASVAAMTAFMENSPELDEAWDLYCVATTGEENDFNGAITASFGIDPDIAIVLDVTFGKSPGSRDWQTFEIGKGITIGLGPNLHPKLIDLAVRSADRFEIPYTKEIMPVHSGTDAYAVQVAREGIPTLLIEIPVRYMHSPAEVVSANDVDRAARFLQVFIRSLNGTTMDAISLEEKDEDRS